MKRLLLALVLFVAMVSFATPATAQIGCGYGGYGGYRYGGYGYGGYPYGYGGYQPIINPYFRPAALGLQLNVGGYGYGYGGYGGYGVYGHHHHHGW